ncbi:MAG: hypothetical protein MUF54_22490, partial [Polyangiaceae bacterium]|nr:hypothetical protein [Polyangiaceae bacterium]
RPSLGRRLLNFFSTAFGTDINQRLVDMIARQPCSVVSDEPSLLGGMYRVVPLQRPPDIETREQGRRDR